jgi:hypothetical protein
MKSRRAIQACAVAGMVAAVVWAIALVIEYQYGLRSPSNTSALYKADQAAFYLAQVGYLVMVIGLFRSRAGGEGWFGRIAIGIWIIAIVAIVLGQALGALGIDAVFLLPVSGAGQILGSVLTSVAIWRAGRWTGWRRWAQPSGQRSFSSPSGPRLRPFLFSLSPPLLLIRRRPAPCWKASGRRPGSCSASRSTSKPAAHPSRCKEKAGHASRPFSD